MQFDSMLNYVRVAMASVTLATLGTAAQAQDMPSFMAPIAGRTDTTPAQTATNNVLALNTGMFELYGDAARVFKRNILSKHPVILGLFSGAGGRFILYRPGQPPLDAPSVPVVYQLLKSIGHSTMALTQVVGPYLDNPADQSWRGSMLAYRSRMKSALDGLDLTPMPLEWRENNRIILAEQPRIHGRLRGEGRHLLCRAGGLLQEAGPLSQEGYRMGGADPGRPLDVRDRRVEDHARRRLGEDLRGQQHDLCGAPEQHPVQRAGAVLRAGGRQQPADADRDDLVHYEPRRDARVR